MHYITMIVLFCWFGCVGLFLPPPPSIVSFVSQHQL